MKKRGITLIELILVLAIFALIITAAFDYFVSSQKIYIFMSRQLNEQEDMRIALEFFTMKIMNASEVRLYDGVNSNPDAGFIRVVSREGNPVNYMLLNGKRVFVEKDIRYVNGVRWIRNIVRYDTSSQQVVSGVYAFEVSRAGSNLYFITVYMENPKNPEDADYPDHHCQSTYISVRS